MSDTQDKAQPASVDEDSSPKRSSGDAPSLAAKIAGIAGSLAHSKADAASCRRADPERPQSAFWKLAGLHDLLGEREDDRLVVAWSCIVTGLAHLESLHRRGEPLGRALARSGYSEARLGKLLSADPDRVTDELGYVARFLRAKQVPVDWLDAAVLILATRESVREHRRRHIARSYYAELPRES